MFRFWAFVTWRDGTHTAEPAMEALDNTEDVETLMILSPLVHQQDRGDSIYSDFLIYEG